MEDPSSTGPSAVRGAAGVNHVVIATNEHIRIQTKEGTVLSTVSLASFWAPLGFTGVHRPTVAYDPYGARWIMAAATIQGRVLAAVSASDDPGGTWYLRSGALVHQFELSATHVGFSRRWIVVVHRREVFIWKKADFYANLTTPHVRIGWHVSITPAITYDPNLDELYFAASLPARIDPSGRYAGVVELYRMQENPAGAPYVTPIGEQWGQRFLDTSWLTAPLRNASAFFPQSATPAASAPRLSVDSVRETTTTRAMDSVVHRNGYIWGADAVFRPARPVSAGEDTSDQATQTAIVWFQATASGIIIQQGIIEDPAGEASYADASITVNAKEDVLISYTRFAAAEYPSAGYATRRANDPHGVMLLGTMKAGEGRYTTTTFDGRVEWGPQGSAAVDPSNDMDMWTVQQYAASRTNGDTVSRWGAWWMRLTPEPSEVIALSLHHDGALPALADSTQTWTAQAYSAVGPVEYRFWRYDGVTRTWTLAQDYGPSNTYTMNWQRAHHGPAAFQVWVRRVGSSASYESYKPSGVFDVVSERPVIISFSATPQGDVPAGTTMQFSTVTRGGVPSVDNKPAVAYKYLLHDLLTGETSVLRSLDFTSSASWATHIWSAGRYTVEVLVGRPPSGGFGFVPDDTRTYGPFEVTSPTPAIRWVSSDAGYAVQRGTPVEFVALGVGGTGPLEYRFWRYDLPPASPSGSWTLVQDYSPNNRYRWVVPGDGDVGIHLVQAWVRHEGSSADYEGYNSTDYFRVTPRPPPTIQSLTQSGSGPITFTANATGEGPLEYRFWLYRAATNTRTMVRDYSSNNVWVWNPDSTERGTFQVEVWVRNVGSPLDNEAYRQTPLFSR